MSTCLTAIAGGAIFSRRKSLDLYASLDIRLTLKYNSNLCILLFIIFSGYSYY